MTDASNTNATAQTHVPVQTYPQVAQKKRSNLFIILVIVIGVIIFFCCLTVAAIIFLTPSNSNKNQSSNITPTPTPKVTQKNDKNFANGEEKPPLSRSFTDEVLTKTRSLSTKDGYTTNVNALGDPSYTFSILYKPSWKTSKFTKEDYILTSDDGSESIGVLYFAKGTRAYQMNCYELVSDIFSESNWEGLNAGTIEIHDETWSRVTYTVEKGTNKEVKGVDQCLKRDDALLLFFFVATSQQWKLNTNDYNKLINDIYVSKSGLEY